MIAKLVQHNNITKISVNGRIFEPLSFRSFRPKPATTKAMAEVGVKLQSVFPTGIISALRIPYSLFGEIWTGEGQYDWAPLKKQMDQFIRNAPDAYLSLMIQLDTREWFLKEHPEASYSFLNISRVAGYEVWRESAARMICDVLDYLDREYPEKIYAVHLFAGSTCEWLNSSDPAAYDRLKESCFAAWSGEAGRKMPKPEALAHTSCGIFRDPDTDKDALDFWRFHNEIVADAICYFAGRTKKHTGGTKLTGCFYGYLVATPNPASAQLAAQRVFDCPDIDIVFSPASYRFRKLESTSAEQLPIDSIILRKKLYFHEIDNTTHLANSEPYAQVLQIMGHSRMKDLDQTTMYYRREAAQAWSHCGGYWWFDMLGCWFENNGKADNAMMNEIKKITDAGKRLYSMPVSGIAEIAVLVHAASNYYVKDQNLISELLIKQLEPLHRIGAPVDIYCAEDVLRDDFPEDRYKLYLVPNMFAPSEELHQAVCNLREKGKSIIFIYAAGAINSSNLGNGFSAEKISLLTNISVEINENEISATAVPGGFLNDSGMTRIYGYESRSVKPVLKCSDPEAVVYGCDILDNSAQLVIKYRRHINGGGSGDDGSSSGNNSSGGSGSFDCWSMQGPLPSYVLRPLAKAAGVSIYTSDDLPVYANSMMFCLFDHVGSSREVNMPWKDGLIEELYTGERHVLDGAPVILSFRCDETKCFIHLY